MDENTILEDGSIEYKLRLDLNVLNHLGLNLYSNTPAVLSEVVANAWDADADNVSIKIKNAENSEATEIHIFDDGCGMDNGDINNKYLKVGYAKRDSGEQKTPKGRQVMGRKGIGKLSLFSIAEEIEVYSIKGSEKNAFRMLVADIKTEISESNGTYTPQTIQNPDFSDMGKSGTKIILKKLKKRIDTTETFLRRRLARRFSIIGQEHGFQVSINEKNIDINDRDYFHKMEYLWVYGNEWKDKEAQTSKISKVEERANTLMLTPKDGIKQSVTIKGWIGLAEHSYDLQEGAENLNKISVLVRGKMAQEDILETFREGGLYTKYIIGEISADFLDDDTDEDIATSSRQSIIESDHRFIALKEFIKAELKVVQAQRAKLKADQSEKLIESYDTINDWYKSLSKDTKEKAKKLFAKINQIPLENNQKKQVMIHAVLAFENLRYRDALDTLDKIENNNLEAFLEVIKEFDDIEASLYYQITKERLDIIAKLKEKVFDENALEKVLQAHLYQYLWLLDPAWDRATETPLMEQGAKTAFDGVYANLNEEEKKGRIDIRYKKTSGKHVIIELKKADVKTNTDDLIKQVKKYKSALSKLLKNANPQETDPQIDCVCVVGQDLSDWTDLAERETSFKQQAAINMRVVTYRQLINDAYISYGQYLEKSKEKGKVISLIQAIEKEMADEV